MELQLSKLSVGIQTTIDRRLPYRNRSALGRQQTANLLPLWVKLSDFGSNPLPLIPCFSCDTL